MKHFIMTVPMQSPENLHKTRYNAMNNAELESSYETFYPVFAAMDNCIAENETVTVSLITVDHENTRTNIKYLLKELESFAAAKNFKYELKTIETPYDETIDTHLDLFSKLIDNFSAEDEITADITYGSKPMPMILFMALNYAKLNIKGADVERVIYGRYSFVEHKAFIHDVSALIYMNSVVEKLGKSGSSDTRAVISSMLGL